MTSGALVNGDILVGFAAPPQGSATKEIDMLCENCMPIRRAVGNRVGFARALRQPARVTKAKGKPSMTQAYYSAVLDRPMDEVWSLIRDFNNYPAYIDGVSESVIEDDRRGDEVGAIRRFCYLGNWIRQRLVDHSDGQHTLTYAGLEALPYPQDDGSRTPAPTRYQGTMHLRPIVEGDRTLIEWSVALETEPADADRWQALFASWIPDWTDSLARTLARSG
ncbi:SRPBCC family protein [uncultured Bradyrhizobium sp.]|uniref:SRPBCC family protein n=1 Tax=uncultured Bradyrhizobium sp. TaxID=199684 RepID=UPI0026366607|nr:SRPBCC family protein [uncultured Bradyrhizobium sp.]